MIIKINDTLEKQFWQYVSHEESLNLFIIGYVENYGFSSGFQDIWAQIKEETMTSVILRNHSSLTVYSLKNDFDVKELSNHIKTLELESINGKKSVIDRLASIYKEFDKKVDNKFCVLKNINELDFLDMSKYNIEKADETNIGEIGELLNKSDYEVSRNYIEARRKLIKDDIVRAYFIKEDGIMISTASTGMETSFLAIVSSVSTDKNYRRKGLASYMVYNLSKELLLEGKIPCLFYTDEIAGKIYRKIGYEEIDKWTKIFK